jgi:internalin A
MNSADTVPQPPLPRCPLRGVGISLSCVVLSLLVSCGRTETTTPTKQETAKAGPSTAEAVVKLTVEEVLKDPALLHARLKKHNPTYDGKALVAPDPDVGLIGEIGTSTVSDLAGLRGIPFGALDLRGTRVTDISALAGMPLRLLGLEGTKVTDLKPLRGAPLIKLYLNHTPVTDLSPLADAPIQELMLVGAPVADLAPLRKMPLKLLWLNETKVTDLTPIAGCPLLSLTLHRTQVSDLTPLASMTTLQRLHIGETRVADLTPIAGLALKRLIFDPTTARGSLDSIRNMASLNELGTTLEGRTKPEQFWQLHGGDGSASRKKED